MAENNKNTEKPSFYDIVSAIASFCDKADMQKQEQSRKA